MSSKKKDNLSSSQQSSLSPASEGTFPSRKSKEAESKTSRAKQESQKWEKEDKLHHLKEEVKLLVGEVENQRAFIENLKHRLQFLESAKQEVEGKNLFLQKNLQRLIHEKVNLLHQIEEMKGAMNLTDGEIESLTSSEALEWMDELDGFLHSFQQKIGKRMAELERRYLASQKRLFEVEEELEQVKQENRSLANEKNRLQEMVDQIRENHLKISQALGLTLTGPISNSSLDQEDIPTEKLRPPLRKEELLQGLPSGEGSSFSLHLYEEFLLFLDSKGCSSVQPVPSPDTAIGYAYKEVREWGKIAHGEEASFLEYGVEQGFLTKSLVNKIHLCPQCFRYNLNLRKICPHCAHIHYSKKQRGNYTCQNCQKDYPSHQYRFDCLNCGFSFSLEKAILCNLYEYGLVKGLQKQGSPRQKPSPEGK